MSSTKQIFMFIIFFISIFCISAKHVSAATQTAASCSYSDVSNAVSAASSGDVVSVPSGTCSWGSQLVITKGLTFQGAGLSSTFIEAGFTAPAQSNNFDTKNYLIVYKPANPALNEPFRVSGMSLDCKNITAGIDFENYTATVINKIRVDHNIIKNCDYAGGTARAIQIHGTVYGVIDNNTFSGNVKQVDNYGAGVTSWNTFTVNPGSADYMYIEDNIFTIWTSASSGGVGGRYVARYNTYYYTRNSGLYPWFDMHGNQGTGSSYATMGAEIYGNNLIATYTNQVIGLFDQRGGRTRIFGNQVNSTVTCSEKAREEVDDIKDPTKYGGYASDGEPQHVSDSYYWNNRQGSNLVVAFTENSQGVSHPITEDQDFWQMKASFDGTSGIGCGPLDSRPSTCTPGVGYWATNQSCSDLTGMVGTHPTTPISGALYKCTAPNKWTLYYQPYTYPHPLRGEAATPPTFIPPQPAPETLPKPTEVQQK